MEGANRSVLRDEIEITLYDGTGYPDLQGYPEDVPAPDDRPYALEYSSPDGDDGLNGLFGLSVSFNTSEHAHGSEDIGTPESPSASYTVEELYSWDLLSEPLSGPYEPIDASEQPLPVFNSPVLDLDPEVLIPVPGIEEGLAVNTPTPPREIFATENAKGTYWAPINVNVSKESLKSPASTTTHVVQNSKTRTASTVTAGQNMGSETCS